MRITPPPKCNIPADSSQFRRNSKSVAFWGVMPPLLAAASWSWGLVFGEAAISSSRSPMIQCSDDRLVGVELPGRRCVEPTVFMHHDEVHKLEERQSLLDDTRFAPPKFSKPRVEVITRSRRTTQPLPSLAESLGIALFSAGHRTDRPPLSFCHSWPYQLASKVTSLFAPYRKHHSATSGEALRTGSSAAAITRRRSIPSGSTGTFTRISTGRRWERHSATHRETRRVLRGDLNR